MIIYLALAGVAAVAVGLGFYLGRVTAPECERDHHQTQIHIGHARLTKIDADGKPVGPSVPLPSGARSMTLEFTAEQVNPRALDLLTGAAVRATASHDSGRHRVVEPDEEVTQVIRIEDDQL